MVVLSPMAAFAGGRVEGQYSHGHMWGGGGHMVYGGLLMVLVLAVIIGVIVLVARGWGGSGYGRGPAEKSPLDILNDRYARGEMTTKEFEERRKTLGG